MIIHHTPYHFQQQTHSNWRDAERREPCTICGKPDWCSISTDGAWAICRRLRQDGAIPKRDKHGAEYYLYRLDGQPLRKPVPTFPEAPTARLADVATRDRAYRALLSELGLSTRHHSDLGKRGLSATHITSSDYATMPLQGRSEIAQRLVDAYGEYACAGVPGFFIASDGSRRWWSLAGAVGLLIPVRDLTGCIVALKVRADDNGNPDKKYTYVSSKNHGGPTAGALCHVPLHGASLPLRVAGLPTDVVRLTEGELKGDISTALSGVLTIAVPGVGQWRLALPVLKALSSRRVLLAFDADWRSNPHVERALAQAAYQLTAEGFIVHVEAWDLAIGKGIDDVLAAGKYPEMRSVTPWLYTGRTVSEVSGRRHTHITVEVA